MIKLEIEAIDATHLRKQLAEILGGVPAAVPQLTPTTTEIPRTRGGKKADATVAESLAQSDTAASSASDATTAAEVGSEATGADTGQTESEPHALTYDGDIKPAVLKVSAHDPAKGGGREGVLALMAQFDVDHINKVPEEKWPELLDAINIVLEG